ncbi:MAG: hypothetical protein U0V73_12260 [Acidimicrobiia bacterium]
MTGPSFTRAPRLNHVAMSVPADLLDAKGRAEILDFYGDVFGFEEHPSETVDRTKLVLRVHSHEQFVFLHADDNPMGCPRLDHFGMSVATMDELDDMLARAKARQARDPRVDIIDRNTDDFGMLALTAFYVGFLLPMMVEVQHWNWTAGRRPPE